MIDLILPWPEYEFTYGIPIAIFIKNRGENGFNTIATFTDKNKFYISLGFAHKNNFSNFEILSNVDCRIFYVSNTLVE